MKACVQYQGQQYAEKNSENDMMMAFTIDIELYMESSANMNHRHIFIKFSNEIERWILRNKLQHWNNDVKIPKQFKNVLQIFILYSVRTVYCARWISCIARIWFFFLSLIFWGYDDQSQIMIFLMQFSQAWSLWRICMHSFVFVCILVVVIINTRISLSRISTLGWHGVARSL